MPSTFTQHSHLNEVIDYSLIDFNRVKVVISRSRSRDPNVDPRKIRRRCGRRQTPGDDSNRFLSGGSGHRILREGRNRKLSARGRQNRRQ